MLPFKAEDNITALDNAPFIMIFFKIIGRFLSQLQNTWGMT